MLKKIQSYLHEINIVYSCYPNTPITGFLFLLKMIYWHVYIRRFVKTDFVSNYIFGIKIWYNPLLDGCKYSYFLPKIDYVIKHLEHTYLQEGDIFIDIGSNIGNHALIAYYVGADVHVFEPNDKARMYFEKNIELSPKGGSIVVNSSLVGDRDDTIPFYEYGDNLSGLSSFIQPQDLNGIKILQKQIQKLDTYIQGKKINRIKILKIDVEGAEGAVFAGAKEVLEKGIVDIIYWESNALLAYSQKMKILEELTAFGYSHFEFDEKQKKVIPYGNLDNCLSIKNEYIPEIMNLISRM